MSIWEMLSEMENRYYDMLMRDGPSWRSKDNKPVRIIVSTPEGPTNKYAQIFEVPDKRRNPFMSNTPPLGRIVFYNHPGSADGRYPPTQSPAIVQKVYEDGSADLWVFGPKGIHKDGPYHQGNGPCEWTWSPKEQ